MFKYMLYANYLNKFLIDYNSINTPKKTRSAYAIIINNNKIYNNLIPTKQLTLLRKQEVYTINNNNIKLRSFLYKRW